MLIITILIILFTVVILLVLHELGHFVLAKKFGVMVEEFGVGYPPRIWGKKFGETLYSLNLLPFGAFVKITGEDREKGGERSFVGKPLWQRALILLGGIISFWIVAIIVFSFVAGVWGLPVAVSDDYAGKAFVEIVAIAPKSPAEKAGIRAGDQIKQMGFDEESVLINKVKDVQSFVGAHQKKEIEISLLRGEKEIKVSVVPRENPPAGEGAIGIGLARISKRHYSWYSSLYEGTKITVEKTIQLPIVVGNLLYQAIQGKKIEGVQMVGPIGLGKIMGQSLMAGTDQYLLFIGMIAVWLALFNALPIPALDGGRVLFLVIEWIRRKPASVKVEQNVTMFFFIALVALMVLVTIKDIIGLF